MKQQRKTYLTQAETLNFGVFLMSDFRRWIKQREAIEKQEANIVGAIPWTVAIRYVTKEDFKIWKFFFDQGIDQFDDVKNLIIIFKTYENK